MVEFLGDVVLLICITFLCLGIFLLIRGYRWGGGINMTLSFTGRAKLTRAIVLMSIVFTLMITYRFVFIKLVGPKPEAGYSLVTRIFEDFGMLFFVVAGTSLINGGMKKLRII